MDQSCQNRHCCSLKVLHLGKTDDDNLYECLQCHLFSSYSFLKQIFDISKGFMIWLIKVVYFIYVYKLLFDMFVSFIITNTWDNQLLSYTHGKSIFWTRLVTLWTGNIGKAQGPTILCEGGYSIPTHPVRLRYVSAEDSLVPWNSHLVFWLCIHNPPPLPSPYVLNSHDPSPEHACTHTAIQKMHLATSELLNPYLRWPIYPPSEQWYNFPHPWKQ